MLIQVALRRIILLIFLIDLKYFINIFRIFKVTTASFLKIANLPLSHKITSEKENRIKFDTVD